MMLWDRIGQVLRMEKTVNLGSFDGWFIEGLRLSLYVELKSVYAPALAISNNP